MVLNGITSLSGAPLSGDVEICALFGDTNQNQLIDKPDTKTLKAHVGEPLDQMSGNYLFDLDLNGVIGKSDGKIVKANKLHTVP